MGGGWRDLGPDINKLEGVFQNGTCQHQCPHNRTGSPEWLPAVSLPQRELQLPPASLGDSPRSASKSDQGLYQIVASALGLGVCEIFVGALSD